MQKDIRSDGTRRPYSSKMSTIHGWVTKMRGTLLDNEETRRKGIHEMRAAKAIREYKRKRAAERNKTNGHHGGGLFAFLGLGAKGGSRRPPAKRNASSSRTLVQRETTGRSHKSGEVVVYGSHHRARSPHQHHHHHHSRHGTRVEGRSKSAPPRADKGQSMQRRGTSGGQRPSMPKRASTTQARRDGRNDSSNAVRRR